MSVDFMVGFENNSRNYPKQQNLFPRLTISSYFRKTECRLPFGLFEVCHVPVMRPFAEDNAW